jgi:hypothetical protein
MNRLFQTLAVASLVSLFVGCAHELPVASPGGRVDVRITSMHMKPQHVLPGEKWRAVMDVVNGSPIVAEDVAYMIRIPGRNLEIGRGRIGRILPGDTLHISSDDVVLPPGEYRVEGRLFPPSRAQQSGTPNTIVMTVTVGR